MARLHEMLSSKESLMFRALTFSLILASVHILSVDSRPSLLQNESQTPEKRTQETTEEDISRSKLMRDIILDEFIREIIESGDNEEPIEKNERSNRKTQDGVSINDEETFDSENMQGDMPAQDEQQNTESPSNYNENLPTMNYFPTSIGEGIGEDGTIRHVIVRAPGRFNTTEDREAFLEELNLSLSPLNVTLNNENVTIDETVQNARERNKALRLRTIKEHILSLLGMINRSPPSEDSALPSKQNTAIIDDMYNKMKNQTWPPAAIYTEKVQSFYPSCELPKNTDEELWHDTTAMNLLFDLTTPPPANGTTVNVIAAKLRLYKISQGNLTGSGGNCNPQVSGDETQTLTPGPHIDVDQKIRVSVYWYTRSLKKNKLKRKLLDSKMLSVFGNEWTDFNVKQAASEWRSKNKANKNFGLVVEVENDENVILPATQFFSAMNCSKEASTARPIPGFLLDAAHVYHLLGRTNRTTNETIPTIHGTNLTSITDYNSVNFHTYLFPMIDLCTNEIPNHEAENAALYIQAQQMVQQGVQSSSNNSENDTEKIQDQWRLRNPYQQPHYPLVDVDRALEAPTTVQLQNDRALRYPRRQLEGHRHRHHHGDRQDMMTSDHQDDEQEGAWQEQNTGHELRKLIVQRVLLANQNRNTTGEIIQPTDR